MQAIWKIDATTNGGLAGMTSIGSRAKYGRSFYPGPCRENGSGCKMLGSGRCDLPGILVDRRWVRHTRCASSTHKELRGMEASTFDRLTRMAFGGSRRDFVRVLVGAVAATQITPDRVALAQSSGS